MGIGISSFVEVDGAGPAHTFDIVGIKATREIRRGGSHDLMRHALPAESHQKYASSLRKLGV